LSRSSYRLLPDVALADIAYEAKAGSLGGLFEACARALTDVMVDPRTVRVKVSREVELEADSTDGLLYDFLTQLIILKDVDSLLFKGFDVSMGAGGKKMKCAMKGEPIDRERHGLRNDVKAVTMHMFGVKRTGKGWKTTVVLDI
jgi:SHS2 domain-containing protein